MPSTEYSYASVGTFDLPNHRFLVGRRSDEPTGTRYEILDINEGLPLTNREMLSLTFESFPASESGLQEPHYEAVDTEAAMAADLEKKVLRLICVGTQVNLNSVSSEDDPMEWGWVLRINHRVSDQVLAEMGILRDWVNHGMKTCVGREKTASFPDRNLMGLSRLVDRSQMYDSQGRPLRPYQFPSPIQGKVILTDTQLDLRLKRIGALVGNILSGGSRN